jgi:anti-anti-sigma factor
VSHTARSPIQDRCGGEFTSVLLTKARLLPVSPVFPGDATVSSPSLAAPGSAPFARESLKIQRRPCRPGLLVITAEGELDLSSAGLLRRALWQELSWCTVLDLSGVSFMAASALRVLDEAAERARLERRRAGIVAATSPVTRVLQLSGFDRMPVYSRLADAVRELPAAPFR